MATSRQPPRRRAGRRRGAAPRRRPATAGCAMPSKKPKWSRPPASASARWRCTSVDGVLGVRAEHRRQRRAQVLGVDRVDRDEHVRVAGPEPGSQCAGALGPRSPSCSARAAMPSRNAAGKDASSVVRQLQRPQAGERERDVHRRRRRPSPHGAAVATCGSIRRISARASLDVDDPQEQVRRGGHRVAAQDVALDVGEVDVARGSRSRRGRFGGRPSIRRSSGSAPAAPRRRGPGPRRRSRSRARAAPAPRASRRPSRPGSRTGRGRAVDLDARAPTRGTPRGLAARGSRRSGPTTRRPPARARASASRYGSSVAVDRAREHQVRIAAACRVCVCFGPWCTSARKSWTRATCSILEPRERALGAARHRLQIRLELVGLAPGRTRRERRQRVGAPDAVAALRDAPAHR